MTDRDIKESDIAYDNLKTAMQRIGNVMSQKQEIMFEEWYNLSVMDLDYNQHVTASIYGRLMEATFMKYIDDYYNGKLRIYEVGINYGNEMKATRDNKSECKVMVYLYDKHTGEIIGSIAQKNQICSEFRVVLKPVVCSPKL